ncbi:polysaccharide deacetylase family protein [Streptomyces sp. HNM0663]|uniref:Polysaccharide deacetylase family protein n=1 Tax=Streptomyces chengmaiensis TaxID=3040919 RepID=A0ABT6HI30_9ACTN|nr:polysaccharide deacetylase family protein [Streptomyces chengmaiensis]MDH2387991.1 polysaccharide deacetylase family protein [Streptomyces chengmaiensis]
MKKDQPSAGRRSLLRAAAALGATATVGLLAVEGVGRSPRPSAAGTAQATGAAPAGAPSASAAAPSASASAAADGAAGPEAVPLAGSPVNATAYRLRPMTSYAPSAVRRVLPPVRSRPFLKLSGAGRAMVLTFDDGPDPRYTPGILKTLRKYDVPAMFFICGEMADAHRGLLREMADDGHVVGNHTWSHPLIPSLPPSRIRDEMGRTSEVVDRELGSAPLWYRAPFGAWNKHSFEIGAELGMEPLAWTVDTLDWTEPGTGTIVRRVREGAGPGVVVLSHDAGGDRSQSVAALRSYLPWLLDQGYRITVPRR